MRARSSASRACRATASRSSSKCCPASDRSTDGRIFIKQQPFEPTRDTFYRLKIFGLPEEPLKNATVPRMTVAENMAFRTFDQAAQRETRLVAVARADARARRAS